MLISGWPSARATNVSAGRRQISFRRADLHQLALAQHRDAVAESQRLLIVVGDVDRGGVRHGAELFELGPHRGAQLGVEMGQRFVE